MIDYFRNEGIDTGIGFLSMLQIIILAAVAIFLFWRLRAVLGTRDGFEKSVKEVKGSGEIIKSTDITGCLLYTSPSPRDATLSRMPSSA